MVVYKTVDELPKNTFCSYLIKNDVEKGSDIYCKENDTHYVIFGSMVLTEDGLVELKDE